MMIWRHFQAIFWCILPGSWIQGWPWNRIKL